MQACPLRLSDIPYQTCTWTGRVLRACKYEVRCIPPVGAIVLHGIDQINWITFHGITNTTYFLNVPRAGRRLKSCCAASFLLRSEANQRRSAIALSHLLLYSQVAR